MRWFVEVSSLSAGNPGQRLTVEAATWQGALAQGRTSARDTAPLSNFTIEVLADAYRATNAISRTRYVVSRAPEDAPISSEQLPSASMPAAAPSPGANGPSPAATAASALVRRRTPSGVGPASGPAPVAAVAVPRPASEPPPPLADRGKIILRKAEEPGARSPITYRELAIALPPGATKEHALAVARANLDDVRNELANVATGRLVQLAVFDHDWQGRPQRAPLVALTWKDWRGNEPEIKWPGGAPEAKRVAAPKAPEPRPAEPKPAPESAPATTTPSGLQPKAAPFDARGMANEISSAVEAAKPPSPSPSSAAIPAAVEAKISSPLASTQAVVAPPIVAPAPTPAPPAAAPQPVTPAPIAAKPASVRPPAKTPSVKPAPFSPAAPASAPMSAPRSSRPDDLTSELFESMHDLHFMRDALDGADFIVELLREKIPTMVAMVHFYDINAKQFAVVKARAPSGGVTTRQLEGTGLVGDALKSGKPIYVKDAAADQRWSREAYQQAGHASPKQIVIAPMRHGGRYLGAIELADHSDGESFGDNEVHALSYVAEQFAEFVNDRGVQMQRGADSTGSFQVIEPQRPRR